MRHQIAYLIYGNDTAFLEGRWSVLSAFARSATPPDVLVCTDQPERFAGWPVRTLTLTPDLDRQWRGPDAFHFRMKIELVASILDDADKTILADGDTLFLQDSAETFDRIDAEHSVLHHDEGPMSLDDECLAAWRLIDRPEFAKASLAGGPHMWNAGVIGLHRSHRPAVDEARRITDAVFGPTKWKLAEQFAFSLALAQQTAVRDAAGQIEHYWLDVHYPGWHGGKTPRTLYREQAAAFFAAHESGGFDAMVAAMRERPPVLYHIGKLRRWWAGILRRTVARQYGRAAPES